MPVSAMHSPSPCGLSSGGSWGRRQCLDNLWLLLCCDTLSLLVHARRVRFTAPGLPLTFCVCWRLVLAAFGTRIAGAGWAAPYSLRRLAAAPAGSGFYCLYVQCCSWALGVPRFCSVNACGFSWLMPFATAALSGVPPCRFLVIDGTVGFSNMAERLSPVVRRYAAALSLRSFIYIPSPPPILLLAVYGMPTPGR